MRKIMLSAVLLLTALCAAVAFCRPLRTASLRSGANMPSARPNVEATQQGKGALGELPFKKVGEYTSFGEMFNIDFAKSQGTRAMRFHMRNTPSNIGQWVMIVANDEIEPFVEALKRTCDKYAQWLAIAKANNVNKLDKTMEDITLNVHIMHQYYKNDKWRDIPLSIHPAVFTYDKGVIAVSFLFKPKYDRSVITHTVYMSLNNLEEMRALLAVLDIADMERRYDSNQSVDDLFK